MNLQQVNKFRMMNACQECLEKTPTHILTKKPAIAGLTTKLATLNDKIKAANDKQKGVTGGSSADKIAARDQLLILVSGVGGNILSYATANSKIELAGQMTKQLKKLEKISDTEFLSKCRIIHSNAVTEVANLGPYGITVETNEEMKIKIDDYDTMAKAFRNKQSEKKVATSFIAGFMKEATKLLRKEIDPVIYSLTDEKAYVDKYRNDREIIDLGHTFTQFKGVAVNKITKVELSNVQIDLIGNDGELIVKTDASGKYRQRLHPDTYTIKVTHPEFEAFEIDNVKIHPGEIKVENFELVPKI
jgi:hypothetical protein